MGILSDTAKQALAEDVCHLIDEKAADNRSKPDVQQVLRDLRMEVLGLLPYPHAVPVRVGKKGVTNKSLLRTRGK